MAGPGGKGNRNCLGWCKCSRRPSCRGLHGCTALPKLTELTAFSGCILSYVNYSLIKLIKMGKIIFFSWIRPNIKGKILKIFRGREYLCDLMVWEDFSKPQTIKKKDDLYTFQSHSKFDIYILIYILYISSNYWCVFISKGMKNSFLSFLDKLKVPHFQICFFSFFLSLLWMDFSF